MDYMAIANGAVVWILCILVVGLVLVQSAVFMRRGWKRSLELGVSPEVLKKASMSSVLISIIPTIPVILILLVMLPILGLPLPWLRLSIIGSGAIELLAATTGAEAVGEEFVAGGITLNGYIAAMWVGCISAAFSSFLACTILRPISRGYSTVAGKNAELMGLVATCALAAATASSNVNYGLRTWKTLMIAVVGFVVALGLSLISKKTNWRGARDYSLPAGLIAGMCVAIVLG